MNEIERKFLVKNKLWEPINEGFFIQQGFLNTAKERVVRIRLKGDKAFLTVKGKIEGITRKEFEYEIPYKEGKQLLDLCEFSLIEKTRYHFHYKEMLWEVDEFYGDNKGLIIAEIELENEAQVFEKPDWLGEEVTQDFRYYNNNLTKFPYTKWNK